MGRALLSHWMEGSETFTIVDPFLGQALAGTELVKARGDLQSRRFDVIIAAIKPQQVDEVLPDYRDAFTDNGYLLSIAAGCSISRLKKACGNRPIIRVMPNLPAAIGAGVSGLCSSPDASAAHTAHAAAMMQRAGTVIPVESEDALDRVTAVAGSGPGYVFEMARSYTQAATDLGFSEKDALQMVLGTIAGTVAMAQQSGQSLEELRNSVTSKNGTTEAGLNALNGSGAFSDLIAATLHAAYHRAVELR